MEASGIDVVCGITSEFLTELLNRIGICKLAPLYLPAISLKPSISRGEILASCLGIELAVRTEISTGKLRIYVELRSAPGGAADFLAPLLNASPFEMDLAPFEVAVHPVQTGLKVCGAGNHLLIFGLHCSEGTQGNWDSFYNSYTGLDLIEVGNQWGVFVTRQITNAIINRIADQALANLDDLSGMDLSNMVLEQIVWPGGELRLKGTGTYNMGCSLGGSADINFRWEAAVTLIAQGSKLSANFRLCKANPRGEEDVLKAFFCSHSIGDLLLGLFTGFTNILVKIISALVANSEENSLTKELIDLAIPETGAIRIEQPIIATDGIGIQGKNASEINTSQIGLPSELVLFSEISSPFIQVRPHTPITKDLVITNLGGASLTVCSGEFANGGIIPFEGHWHLQNCCTNPRIALPGGQTSLTVTFEPLAAAQFDKDYVSTLTLNMVTKAVDAGGNCTYSWESRMVQVKARYEFNHYDGVYQKPWIGIGLQPDEINIEAGMDQFVGNVIPDMPWVDIPIPDDGLQIFEFTTLDPLVKSVQVIDSQNNLVADVGQSFPAIHVSQAVLKGQVLGCKANSIETGISPIPSSSGKSKTILKCKKKVLLPAGTVALTSQITQASLVRDRLLITSGINFYIYDVTNPAHPTLVGASKMAVNPICFAISPVSQLRGGFLQVHISTNRLTTFGLEGLHSNAPRSYQLSKQSVNLPQKSPVRIQMRGLLCLVAAAGGISLYDLYDIEKPQWIAGLKSNSKVNDAQWIQQNVFLATDRGVEVISIRKPSNPERINMIKTATPVTSLQVGELYLYANLAANPYVPKDEGQTFLINLRDLKAQNPVGQYSKPIWRSKFTTDGGLAFLLSKDRMQLKLYTCQAVLARKP